MSIYNKNQGQGFTIVEVLIIAPIVILMIGIFISAIVSMTGEVLSSRGSNDMAYDVQNALDKIQQDVKLSGGFLSTNNVVLSTPQGYNNDTTNFDNASASTGDSLILNSYATINNPLDTDRTIMYMSGQPNACNSTQLNQNQPVMINIIYFVKDGTLWRRTVMPSNYLTVGCVSGSVGAPWQIPSCVPGYTNSFCKTQDERLVDGIETNGFSVSYYSSPESTSANTTADDPSQLDSVRQSAMQTTTTVGVTISAAGKVSGRDISQSASARATSQNNNTQTTADAYWSVFSMSSGWSDYDTTYNTNGYRKTKNGVVILKGLIKKSSAIVPYETIGTLPVGYRPSEQMIFETTTNPNVFSRIDVYPDGRVTTAGSPVGDAGWVSLENIKFLSSDAPASFTALTLSNGWLAYGSPFPTLSYAFDGDGRVHTKGLIKNGTVTDGTPIANLPANARPSEYHHIVNSSYNGSAYIFGYIGVGSDVLGGGNILAKGMGVSGSTWLSTQSMFFPASYTGWTGMPLRSGWTKYACAACTSPKYTKASDGLVSLAGLAANAAAVTSPCSTSGTAFITTLPEGYRPAKRVLFGTADSGQFSRVDIDAGGNVMVCSGPATTTANTWVSLDGLTFYADQ
jgi:hypothetical protein